MICQCFFIKNHVFLYKSIFWFADSKSPWKFESGGTGEIIFYGCWMFFMIVDDLFMKEHVQKRLNNV